MTTKLDLCPKCGSDKVDGPTGGRRKIAKVGQKYQKTMRFNCRGCDHVYQFDVTSPTREGRERQAIARWIAARPIQMVPTQYLINKLGETDQNPESS